MRAAAPIMLHRNRLSHPRYSDLALPPCPRSNGKSLRAEEIAELVWPDAGAVERWPATNQLPAPNNKQPVLSLPAAGKNGFRNHHVNSDCAVDELRDIHVGGNAE